MKQRIVLIATVFLQLVCGVSANESCPIRTLNNADENLASSIGLVAYLYAFPLYMMHQTIQEMISPSSPDYAPMGAFGHARHLLTPKDTMVVSPNNDTIYSHACIDLATEPYILHIPTFPNKRYYSFAFYDAWTNVFKILGSRTRGYNEGNYLIVGPNWKGKTPSGLKKIVTPTNLVLILVRTLVEGKSDLSNVRALQKKYGITPLSVYNKTGKFIATPAPAPIQTSNADIPSDLIFFNKIGHYLKQTPPLPSEKSLLGWFKEIGITINGLDLTIVNPSIAHGLSGVKKTAENIMNKHMLEKNKQINGWIVSTIPENFGDNYLMRATIAYKALLALPSEEAMYPLAEVDTHGKPLAGKNDYVLHFDKEQLPPVTNFWSLSMYNQKNFYLVENSIDRYSIGNRTPGVQYNKDGSLDIYIQHTNPTENASNWLPAPADEFYVILRLYSPKESVLDGTWKIPGIVEQKNSDS